MTKRSSNLPGGVKSATGSKVQQVRADKKRLPKKLYDTERIPAGGRVEEHWKAEMLTQVFKQARKGPAIPASLKWWDPEDVLKHFKLRAFEFGNWLNQEDRYEYLIGAAVSMHDLAHIIGFDRSQIGLRDNLSIAFGARGVSAALAHFEPLQMVINLTRYKKADSWLKDGKYLASGGVGSFGHEWAHALDYFISTQYDTEFKDNYMLSSIITECIKPQRNGTFKKVRTPKGGAAKAMLNFMTKLCYSKPVGSSQYELSDYFRRVLRLISSPNNSYGKYWIMPAELFARAFEVFLFYEGARKGIVNPYLRSQKYVSQMYCTEDDYKSWRKEMIELLDYAGGRI